MSVGSTPTSGTKFQRTYRDAHRRLKRTTNWYVEYVVGGRTIREATKYGKRSDAIEFLKKRVSDGLIGKIVLSNQVTFDDLKNLIVNDYRNNGRKSLPRRELWKCRFGAIPDRYRRMAPCGTSAAAFSRAAAGIASGYEKSVASSGSQVSRRCPLSRCPLATST